VNGEACSPAHEVGCKAERFVVSFSSETSVQKMYEKDNKIMKRKKGFENCGPLSH
jgi:hypothetical protein